MFEDGVIASPIDIVGKRDRNLRLIRVCLCDDRQPVRIGIGQGLEENRVNDTEDRRIRADPEREGDDGDESETG